MYDRYREYAEARGMTDYAISKATGVSPQTISDWKLGKHIMSLGNRYKIAQFLGTNPDFTQKIS